MWLYEILKSIELFIILNPLKTIVALIFICTLAGSYLESIIGFWNNGLYKCNKCNEQVILKDINMFCTDCNEYKSNDKWQEGYNQGAYKVRKDLLGL